jgi:hypothetical protein
MASPPGPLAGHQGRAAATDLPRHMAGGPDRGEAVGERGARSACAGSTAISRGA